jgi:hypothetical protein
MKNVRRISLLAAVAVVAAALGVGMAVAEEKITTTGKGKPAVYQGTITGQSVVLGPQAKPTHIVNSPALPAGQYVVQYSVGAVIGHNDNVVCAASNVPGANDGVFGTAGNGSTESGEGAGGIYGSASAVDTIVIAKSGEQVSITCNSGQGNKGTYVAYASLVLTKVGAVTTDKQ